MAIVCAAYATQRISSLRNGMHKNCLFGTYRAPATTVSSLQSLPQFCNHPNLHRTGNTRRSRLPEELDPQLIRRYRQYLRPIVSPLEDWPNHKCLLHRRFQNNEVGMSDKKTAIVTGASRGIGAGLVEAFLKRGYSVVANSRTITEANPFPASTNVALVDGDIGDPRTAAKIVETAVSRFGRIDVLINNAGVFIPKPFTEYTTEDFNTLVSTTLAGFLYVSQLAVKQMLRQKSGSIVNVSTTLVDQPVGRIGEVKEVVDAALFLTDATFTSGEILHVDGGAHAGKW